MSICCFVTDTKNSIGLAGCIEEVAHNAIAVYWNPLESAAKVRHMNISLLFLSQHLQTSYKSFLATVRYNAF